MGSLFSKPESSLQENLLKMDEEEIVLKPGDLLLVASTELEICLNSELWAHVAIVVYNSLNDAFAYHSGVLEDLDNYISRHNQVEVRQLDWFRPGSFDAALYDSVVQSAKVLAETTLEIDDREGYAIASVLDMVGILSVTSLYGIRPHDFSSQSQILTHYSEQTLLGERSSKIPSLS